MSWPPRGSSSFPLANPPAFRRQFYVATPNAAGTLTTTGPFFATRVPDSQNIQIQRQGELITIDDRVNMPLESKVRTRCVLTDVVSNTSYEVVQARTFATFIECLIARTQADL